MDLRDWALAHGSGSLRQAVVFDMSWREMALHERVAMEIATAAELVPASRLTVGPFMAEPDSQVTTELGWYGRTLRHRWSFHPVLCRAQVRVVYFKMFCEDDAREGAGFVVDGVDLPWIPTGRTLLIPLAIWDTQRKAWGPAENPL